jgi:hypothetical protein
MKANMKTNFLFKCCFVLCLFAYAHFVEAGFMFSANLSGDQEVPPAMTLASGLAMGELTGTSGSYVFNYQIDYAELSSPIIDAVGDGH